MTRRALLMLLLALLSAARVYAGDFTATVNRHELTPGESFTLNLSLARTQANSSPDVAPLRENFTIESEGQSSSTSIVNATVSTSLGWQLTLVPKASGRLTIPALSVETPEGTLHSNPITVNVADATTAPSFSAKPSQIPVHSEKAHVSVTAEASTLSPYKDQSLLYTVKIIVRGPVTDVALNELSVENVVIEKSGKPKISDTVENGLPVKLIEIRYILTPLATGVLTIPPMKLQGKAIIRTMPQVDPFSENLQDPLAVMRAMNAMGGMERSKPFTVSSNEIHLTVKPPAAQMDPWLPLNALSIREEWNRDQEAKVGEPLTRKITLTANGMTGKQLPGLEAQQNRSDFKVYGDKPVFEDSFSGGSLIGKREESYNLIAQKPGRLTLPAVKVAWWNIAANRMEYAQLPPRTLNVPPAEPVAAPPPLVPARPVQPAASLNPAPSAAHYIALASPTGENILYGIIVLLVLALLFTVIWALRLNKKNRPGEKKHVRISSSPARLQRAVRKNAEAANSAEELIKQLKTCAQSYCGTPANVSVESAATALAIYSGTDEAEARKMAYELSAAVYGGKPINLYKMKDLCNRLLQKKSGKKGSSQGFAETAGFKSRLKYKNVFR